MAACAVTAWAAPAASAETIYGLTDTNRLVTFDSTTPGAVSAPLAITGLASGETVKGIDVRPATLQLYALGSTGRLYRIDVVTGAATAVGSPLTISGTDADIDFNPTSDRLRIVTDSDLNLRVNPNDGTGANDTNLSYADASNPNVTGAAYTNNAPPSSVFPAAPTTTLLDIDSAKDALVTQNPPNAGTLTVTGPLGVDVTGDVGFDISTSSGAGGTPGTNTGYAVMRAASDAVARLYTINLTSGAATAVGQIAGTDKVKDLAVAAPVPQLAVLVGGPLPTSSQQIVTVRADRPGSASTPVTVSGLSSGSERLVGIDRRPSGGLIYGVSDASRVYTINPTTGAATPVATGAFTPSATGAAFGLDFNPVSDLIRLVSDEDQNLRISPVTGTVSATDQALAYAAGDPSAPTNPNVTAAAHTNPVSPAPAATTLFDLDTGLDILATQTQNPPNAGTLNTVGPLGVDSTNNNGFDIAARFNHQFAALQAQTQTGLGASTLYAIYVAVPQAAPNNTLAVAIGALGLPMGTFPRGLTVINDNALPAAPTPTPTPTPTGTATATPTGTATATATPTGTATATPTGTATATPYPIPTATPYPVARRRPGLSARVRPKRDRRRPFRFRTRGRLRLPSGVSRAAGCRGKVGIRVKRKGSAKTLSFRLTSVKRTCRFTRKVTFKNSRRFGKGKARRRGTLRFRIRFQGNSRLRPRTINRTARYGP